jgi:hypothetical protein
LISSIKPALWLRSVLPESPGWTGCFCDALGKGLPVDETEGCIDGGGLGCEDDGVAMAAGSESGDVADGRVVMLMVFTSGGDLFNERTGPDRCEVVKPYPCALNWSPQTPQS